MSEGEPKGGISRLAQMRKPECTVVHEDFRIKRNAEITLLVRPRQTFRIFFRKRRGRAKIGTAPHLIIYKSR